jgi:hypothetical protein
LLLVVQPPSSAELDSQVDLEDLSSNP